MNRILTLTLIAALISVFACDDHTKNYEPLQQSVFLGDTCQVAAQEFYEDQDKKLRITDSINYDTLRSFCTGLPEIDFSDYDVVGQFTPAKACSTSYKRSAERNKHSNTLNVFVEIRKYGDCPTNFGSWNLVKVPKLDTTQKVQYKVTRDRVDQ